MFNPNAFDNSLPGGHPVLEIAPPNGAEGAPRRFVPLRLTTLHGKLSGPLADLRLVQTFGFSKAQSTQVVEALYRFPLPGDAAVTGVRVTFGEVEIVAELKSRAVAEKAYGTAMEEGRPAALAPREAPDVFTLQVAGLSPDQEVRVETSFVLLARPEGRRYSLRLPLTNAPRYVREDEQHSAHAKGQPLALARDPGHRFRLEATVVGDAAVSSPTHELAVVPTEGGQSVTLAGGEVTPDRDCVLTWGMAPDQPPLQAFSAGDDRHDYFLALVAPPPAPAQAIAREVLVLLDHSGSMEGPKWAAADWAVESYLSHLTPEDSFALCLFHSTTKWYASELKPADEKTVQAAAAWLKQQRDSGGTNLGVALEEALALPRAEGDRARTLLIVTDAEVTDAGRVLRLAGDEAAHPDRRRISVLCIDAAPNSFLAAELAARGGGLARFLTSDPKQEDITTALDEVLAAWAAPAATGLRLAAGRAGLEAAERVVVARGEEQAIDLGDVAAGQALWAAGRVPRGDEPLHLTLSGAGGLHAEADARPGPGVAALKALFGARRINALEHLMHAHYPPDQLADLLKRLGFDPAALPQGGAVYAENAQRATLEALGDLLAREALRYGLPSAQTAFVAERREAGKKVEAAVPVANALPAGWSDAFLTGGAPSRVAQMRAAPPGSGGPMPSGMPLPAMQPMMAMAGPLGAVPGGGQQMALRKKAKAVAVFEGALSAGALYDSAAGKDALPAEGTLAGLELRAAGKPDWRRVDPSATLLLYVGDPAAPRARVRLADLLRHGRRPLNLRRGQGDVVRLVLEGDASALAGQSVTITLEM